MLEHQLLHLAQGRLDLQHLGFTLPAPQDGSIRCNPVHHPRSSTPSTACTPLRRTTCSLKMAATRTTTTSARARASTVASRSRATRSPTPGVHSPGAAGRQHPVQPCWRVHCRHELPALQRAHHLPRHQSLAEGADLSVAGNVMDVFDFESLRLRATPTATPAATATGTATRAT